MCGQSEGFWTTELNLGLRFIFVEHNRRQHPQRFRCPSPHWIVDDMLKIRTQLWRHDATMIRRVYCLLLLLFTWSANEDLESNCVLGQNNINQRMFLNHQEILRQRFLSLIRIGHLWAKKDDNVISVKVRSIQVEWQKALLLFAD